DYAVRAGRAAARVFAWEEVIAHWQAALEVWGEGDGDSAKRAALLERMGEAYYISGLDWEAGVAVLEEALQIQIEIGDELGQARIRSRLGRSLGGFPPIHADIPRALEHLDRAIEILERSDNEIALAAALISRASARGMNGDFEGGLADVERSLEIADRLGVEVVRAGSELIQVQIFRTQGHMALALETGFRAMETAQRNGFGFVSALTASSVAGTMAGVLFDPTPTFPIFEGALEALGPAQAPAQRGLLVNGLAFSLGVAGRIEELRALLPELREDGMNEDYARMYFDWDVAASGLDAQREDMRARGVRALAIGLPHLYGMVHELKGDDAGARAAYLDIIASFDEVGVVEGGTLPCLHLAMLEARCGDVAAAGGLIERARRIFEGPEDYCGQIGVLRRAEGALAAARGDWAAARTAFEASLEILIRFGVPFEEAETLFVWGNALLRDGDRSGALEKLDQTREVYRRIGAPSQWLERALAAKMRAQGSESSDVKASIALVAASVEAKRPSMSMAAGDDGTVTLMFSDMYDYTGMMERLGDRRALKVVEDHNHIVRTQCEAHGGMEVELRGDGFLVAFPTPMSGVRCAVALQRAFDAYSRGQADQPIRIRIGLHCGEAIRDQDKFFGKTVIHAFRVADLAERDEILVSGHLQGLVADRGLQFGDTREVTLKGFSGTHPITQVEWR
ncbi:MAG: adenylate/guanylate cyclase domain-containing protein, partial [Myxococcota bacterium]